MHNIQASMEDSLNTLLHGDDTEMLREKLALLRREYNRTVQRLRRAERSELVRKHVRSRITEQNHSEVEQSTVTSSDLSVSEVETLASVTPSDSDVYCRGMAVRFSLPPETYSLCRRPEDVPGSAPLSDNHTVDQAGSPTSGRGHRRHTAHRLRSRRSRLRWEQRERSDSQRSESEESSTGQGDGDKMDSLLVPVVAEDCQPEVLSCSKEAGSRGPSAQERCRGREEGLDKPFDRSVSTEGGLKDNTSVEKCGSLADPLLGEAVLSETPEVNFSTPKHLSVPSPSRPPDGRPTSDEAGEQRGSSPPPPPSESGETRCLDSCTMIEGLLFPVEYYVRTTRRMASAQSRIDLGAVIQSQLSHGRMGRGRRRQPAGGVTGDSRRSEVTLQPQALGADGKEESQVLPGPKTYQNSDTDSAVSRRYAGRRQRRGRGGRGRGRTARKHCSLPTPLAPTLETLSTGPNIAADLLSHTGNHVQAAEKELYPTSQTNGRAKMSGFNFGEDSLQRRQTDLCQPLLFQPPGLMQQPLCPTVPPSGGGNFNLRALLCRFDVKDFHLPDDEFGSLKLDKLRSSAAASLDAGLSCRSPYNTRRKASRAPLGADHHKSAASSGGPVGSLAGTDCQQHIQVLASDAPTQLPKEVRSSNSTAQKPVTTAMQSFRVRLPGGKQGRNNFSEDGKDGRVPSPESRLNELHPMVRNTPGSTQGVGMGEGERGGVANYMEVEASPAGMALSPCVLNFCSSTTAHNEKNERPILPLLGSPTFPSLGVTPAFSANSSLPSQNCSASTPLQSAVSQLAAPSTSHDSQRHGAASSGSTLQPLFCQTPKALIQSQNPHPAELVQQKVHAIEVSANQSYSPRTLLPCFSDSLSSSILASITSQCQQSAPSPSLDHSDIDSSPPFDSGEDPYAPTPQTTLKDASVSMKGHVAKSPLAETPSGVDLAPSLSPGSSQKGDSVKSLNPSGPVLLSPFQDCPEAGEGEAPCHVNEGGSMCEASRESHTDVEPLLQAASVDKCSLGEQSLSPGTEAADQDLDSYFTDSAWPSAGQSWPPWGQQSSSQGPLGGQADAQGMAPPTERRSSADILQLMHTLKAPAGRCLVDIWGVRKEMGWSVVTAGEWAVSLWQQTSPEQWCLLHTWPFTEHPVIALLPVPDAPGLVCAALGQLEIREARILSFVNGGGPFSQSVLCTGEIQAVLGVSESRLVCCASSGSTQTVTVAQLTKDGRPQKSLTLVPPGQGVHALAPVEGEPDALIGSTDAGHLLLWNMRTGDLLQSFALGECLLGAACLRGYSEGGVLFVLLQHKFFSQEDGALFSLIATNPITARYVLAHSLIQPALCSGRFTDVDVCGSSLAVAFQCGTLATWDLCQWDLVARLARAPEEGFNVVRWAGPSSLLIGNHSGDVSLYQYTGWHCAAKPE